MEVDGISGAAFSGSDNGHGKDHGLRRLLPYRFQRSQAAAGALAGSSLAVERSPSPARPEVAPPRRFRVRLPETHPEEMVFRVLPSVLPRYLFRPVSLSLVISYRSTPPSPSGRFE